MKGALAAVRTLREDGGCENWRNVTRAATNASPDWAAFQPRFNEGLWQFELHR